MSIHTLKKKGIITCNGIKVSGKPGKGFWLSQGPFGKNQNIGQYGVEGFSLNGGTRNVGYIGKNYCMSKNGTPYYGVFAKGTGGCCGRYSTPLPLFNCPNVKVDTQGKQYQYIKPSVLSTKGMLEKKYRWINNGQYPNIWVQPVYGNSNLSDNASQWLYIQTKAAANICVNDTNKQYLYVDHKRRCGGATGCNTTTARYNAYDIMAANGLYTKTLGIPQTASQYTLQVQRKCANPIGPLKPFPFAVSGGSSSGVGANLSSNHTNGPPVPIITPYYLVPPLWYIES